MAECVKKCDLCHELTNLKFSVVQVNKCFSRANSNYKSSRTEYAKIVKIAEKSGKVKNKKRRFPLFLNSDFFEHTSLNFEEFFFK